jgi:hypothetical protein
MFNWNRIRMTGTLLQDQHTLFIISCSVLLRMRSVSDKRCIGNQKAHFVLNASPPPSLENRAAYDMWKNMTEPDRPLTIRRMRTACRIPNARDTQSQYVTLIVFPLQQWVSERASVLRYTYTACPPWKITKAYPKNTKYFTLECKNWVPDRPSDLNFIPRSPVLVVAVRNLLHVTLLAPRIEVAPIFWKLCEPLHFPHILCLT